MLLIENKNFNHLQLNLDFKWKKGEIVKKIIYYSNSLG